MSKTQVNLLPPAEQKENRLYHIGQQVLHFAGWFVLSLVVLIVVLFAARELLKSQLASVREAAEAKQQELRQLEQSFFQEEVLRLNEDLDNFEKLSREHLNWSEALLELGRVLPGDVTLDAVLLSRTDGKVELQGRAGSRDSVLALRASLLASSLFRDVNFPLSNLERPANAEWHYRFYISPEELKNQ